MSAAQRTLFLAATAVVLALGIWILRFDAPRSSEELSVTDIVETMDRSTNDDPHARLNYELRRLRDPATNQIPDNIRQKEVAFAKRLPAKQTKTSSWQRRGPYTIGGRTRALRVDVRSTNTSTATIVAGGVSGGMWRSTDGGSNWTRTFAPDQRPSVTWVTQDPRSGNRDTWYATTGEFRGNSAGGGGAFYFGNGVYKSTDNAQSWSLLQSTSGNSPTQLETPFELAHRVTVDPSNTSQDEVYVAALGSIHRSLDGGNTWQTVLAAPDTTSPGIAFSDVTVTSSGRVYAVLSDEQGSSTTNSGVYTSSSGDYGDWTDITPSDWPSSTRRTISAVDPSNDNYVWFLTKAESGGSGPNDHELRRYNHQNDTWGDASSFLPDRGGLGTFNSQGAYDLILEVHPDNSDLLFVGDVNLWRINLNESPSDATSWIGGYRTPGGSGSLYDPPGSDPHHPDQHALDFLPSDGDVMFTGSDGGVHRTDDNRTGGDGDVTYTSLNNGYFTTQFYAVCQTQTPTAQDAIDVIAGGMQDNSTYSTTATANLTDPWRQETGADGGYCSIADDGQLRYVSTQGGTVYRNEYDSNGNRTNQTEITPSASGQLFINPYALDPADRSVMYYPAGNSLWRNQTVDVDGGNWTELTGAAVPASHTITALGVSTTNTEHVLYYGTNDGSDTPDPGRVYRLDNADTAPTGTSPTEITGAAFPDGGYVSSIAVDPTDSNKVLVVFSNYRVSSLFYSSDGGQSWSEVEGNLSGPDAPSIRSAAILPQSNLNQTTYYLGTSVGVYSTTSLDGSNTAWVQEGPNTIGTVVADQVQARSADGRVITGTHANGVFSTSAPIPVELASFEATRTSNDIRLRWTTATETNNAGFDVQHQYRDGSFQSLEFIEGAGTTSDAETYQYTVSGNLRPGAHTFRLKQVDQDGSTHFSKTEEVIVSPQGDFELSSPSPNPFQHSTTMQLTVQESQSVTAHVYNVLGQRVQTVWNERLSANQPVPLRIEGERLPSGLYFIQVRGETFETTQKVTLVD